MARSLTKKVFHTVGKAVDEGDMIWNGDRILLGISGGKDSQALLAFCRRSGLPEFHNRCPSATISKRSRVREMLETVYQDNEHVKGNIFRAMGNIASEYLLIQ